MTKINRRDLLNRAGSVSVIGFIGTQTAGKAKAKNGGKVTRKEVEEVLKIVNNESISKRAKKEKLSEYSEKVIKQALLPHHTSVTTNEKEETSTESSVSQNSSSEEITSTVTNYNAWNDKLWMFQLSTEWDYNGIEVSDLQYDTSSDAWNKWSVDSVNVAVSTEKDFNGNKDTYDVEATAKFESFIGTHQTADFTHLLYADGDYEAY